MGNIIRLIIYEVDLNRTILELLMPVLSETRVCILHRSKGICTFHSVGYMLGLDKILHLCDLENKQEISSLGSDVKLVYYRKHALKDAIHIILNDILNRDLIDLIFVFLINSVNSHGDDPDSVPWNDLPQQIDLADTNNVFMKQMIGFIYQRYFEDCAYKITTKKTKKFNHNSLQYVITECEFLVEDRPFKRKIIPTKWQIIDQETGKFTYWTPFSFQQHFGDRNGKALPLIAEINENESRVYFTKPFFSKYQ